MSNLNLIPKYWSYGLPAPWFPLLSHKFQPRQPNLYYSFWCPLTLFLFISWPVPRHLDPMFFSCLKIGPKILRINPAIQSQSPFQLYSVLTLQPRPRWITPGLNSQHQSKGRLSASCTSVSTTGSQINCYKPRDVNNLAISSTELNARKNTTLKHVPLLPLLPSLNLNIFLHYLLPSLGAQW